MTSGRHLPQPDGATERHFTATAYIVAHDRVLLLWHAALGMWLPPGGHCEPNEDPVQAAEREAFEESGVEVSVVAQPGLLEMAVPRVLPPPAVILVEDIIRDDQPFHQHIDCVYFTRARAKVDLEAPIPHGPHVWATREQLAHEFSLPVPGGSLVGVAEDVRLLGVQAIDAVLSQENA